MKTNKIMYIAALAAFAATACDEDKMEWGRPDGYGDIDPTEIPVGLDEAISRYAPIKSYMTERGLPETFQVAIGAGADMYISDEDPTPRNLINENFNCLTFGNAMKHQSVVSASGALNFGTIDAAVALMPADMMLYGHQFIWHTQQQATYLKSLISPKMIIEAEGGIANMLSGDNTDFNGGTSGGWGSWGSGKESAEVLKEGEDGSYCLVLTNVGDGNAWDAQCAYTFDDFLDPEETYVLKFDAKSSSASGALQAQYQNGTTYGSQGGYNDFNVTNEWATYQYEFQVSYENVNRVIINFGKVGGSYYIDNVEFGPKTESADPMANIVTNSSFADGKTTGWTGLWGKYTYEVASPGYDDDYSAHFTISSECVNMWDAQLFWPLTAPLEAGTTYMYSFYAKSSANVKIQFIGQNEEYGGIYKDEFTLPSDWVLCQGEFTYGEGETADIIRVGVQFGTQNAGDEVWIDDFKFGVKNEETNKALKAITYELKTDEEIKTALEGAMEEWISGMCEHMGTRVTTWEVLNEPMTDGGTWRGVDNTGFMSGQDNDGNAYADEPWSQSETEGLKINWQNGHWYWGAFLGKNYAVKAFQLARQYAPHAKLFVNEYGLESNPVKLDAYLELVKYIDDNGGQVDGIGTQMHISTSTDSAGIAQMFTKLAATGKLVRITELDITNGGGTNPTPEQLQAQSDKYKQVLDLYFQIVPAAQQYGVCAWSLSDNEAEHEYWLTGESPNLFDANYERKPAYKGFCDGLAGRVISDDFKSPDYTKQ